MGFATLPAYAATTPGTTTTAASNVTSSSAQLNGLVNPNGATTTFSGQVPAAAVGVVRFSEPSGICEDTAGNVYVASFYSNTVSKIDTSGNITVIAGTGAGGLADSAAG